MIHHMLALLPLLVGQATPAPGFRPDVLVVVIDDVADSDIDDLQARGWLPNISALAAQGVRFRRAYAHAKCAPTRDSLLYGAVLGVHRGDVCAGPGPLTAPAALPSMAEQFRGAGYATLHVGKWHVGAPAWGPWESVGALAGFDAVRNGVPVGPVCNVPGTLQPRLDDGVYSTVSGDNTIFCRDALMDWWATTSGPKFAMVNFGSAHAPFKYPHASLLPPNWPACGLSCTNRREYEAEIIGVDTALGQLMGFVGPSTCIIFVGDNGTPGLVPGESPSVTVATRANQDPARVKLTAYEDGVRVPLIVAAPGVIARESQSLIHVADLWPTLAHAIGLGPRPDDLITGQSFGPALAGGKGPRADLFVWNSESASMAVIERQWKLLTRDDGVEELYDLSVDPLETNPLPPIGADADRLRSRRAEYLSGGR